MVGAIIFLLQISQYLVINTNWIQINCWHFDLFVWFVQLNNYDNARNSGVVEHMELLKWTNIFFVANKNYFFWLTDIWICSWVKPFGMARNTQNF